MCIYLPTVASTGVGGALVLCSLIKSQHFTSRPPLQSTYNLYNHPLGLICSPGQGGL